MNLILQQLYADLEYEFKGNNRIELINFIKKICKELYCDDVKYILFHGCNNYYADFETDTNKSFKLKLNCETSLKLVNDCNNWHLMLYRTSKEINLFKKLFQHIKEIDKTIINHIYIEVNHISKNVELYFNWHKTNCILSYSEWYGFHTLLTETILKEVAKMDDFINYLNEIGIPDDDLYSNGGRIPDYKSYGTWLKKNDPIAFNVEYNEYKRR